LKVEILNNDLFWIKGSISFNEVKALMQFLTRLKYHGTRNSDSLV